MDLYEKIKYTRECRKMTRQELADHLGLSVSFIGHIETGIREIKPSILKEICKILNVPMEFYMSNTDETLDSFLEKHNAAAITANIEKYGRYLKLIDLALDNDVTEEEFKAFLEFRRKVRNTRD